jgi:hypothetical protein
MAFSEQKSPSEPSQPAERKTNRLKRKALRNACVSKSQGFAVFQFQYGMLPQGMFYNY